jgi:hypothetical protein
MQNPWEDATLKSVPAFASVLAINERHSWTALQRNPVRQRSLPIASVRLQRLFARGLTGRSRL